MVAGAGAAAAVEGPAAELAAVLAAGRVAVCAGCSRQAAVAVAAAAAAAAAASVVHRQVLQERRCAAVGPPQAQHPMLTWHLQGHWAAQQVHTFRPAAAEAPAGKVP